MKWARRIKNSLDIILLKKTHHVYACLPIACTLQCSYHFGGTT